MPRHLDLSDANLPGSQRFVALGLGDDEAMKPKGSKCHYSRLLVDFWAPKVYTILLPKGSKCDYSRLLVDVWAAIFVAVLSLDP